MRDRGAGRRRGGDVFQGLQQDGIRQGCPLMAVGVVAVIALGDSVPVGTEVQYW
jgi:hypothetical protein